MNSSKCKLRLKFRCIYMSVCACPYIYNPVDFFFIWSYHFILVDCVISRSMGEFLESSTGTVVPPISTMCSKIAFHVWSSCVSVHIFFFISRVSVLSLGPAKNIYRNGFWSFHDICSMFLFQFSCLCSMNLFPDQLCSTVMSHATQRLWLNVPQRGTNL